MRFEISVTVLPEELAQLGALAASSGPAAELLEELGKMAMAQAASADAGQGEGSRYPGSRPATEGGPPKGESDV